MNIRQVPAREFSPLPGAVEVEEGTWKSHLDGPAQITHVASACMVAAVHFVGYELGYLGHFSTPFSSQKEWYPFRQYLNEVVTARSAVEEETHALAWLGGFNGWQTPHVNAADLDNYRALLKETEEAALERFSLLGIQVVSIYRNQGNRYLQAVQLDCRQGELAYVVGS